MQMEIRNGDFLHVGVGVLVGELQKSLGLGG